VVLPATGDLVLQACKSQKSISSSAAATAAALTAATTSGDSREGIDRSNTFACRPSPAPRQDGHHPPTTRLEANSASLYGAHHHLIIIIIIIFFRRSNSKEGGHVRIQIEVGSEYCGI